MVGWPGGDPGRAAEGLKRKKAALRRILDALESSVTGPA
jgi:hypothetical protein